MQIFRCLRFSVFMFMLLFTANSHAWGSKAHVVIAMLAEERLTPAARAAVERILAGDEFSATAVWADDMRDARDNAEFWARYASTWHYVNIDKGGTYAGSRKNPRGDAYMAIQTFTAILLEEPVPEGPIIEGLKFYFGSVDPKHIEVKRFALKFLLHVIGDLQQPLHSGYAEDRGGNELTLNWFGERTNLHAVWDTLLLASEQRSTNEIATRLSERIGRTPASDVRNMESADPQLWMQECQRLLERIHARHSSKIGAGDSYVAEFVPTVESQIVKGGLRTAFVLNSIFGGWPVGSR